MISLDKLSIVQGSFRLSNVSFEVAEGQYAVLMGRTGCGKTTLLEAICGLRRVQSGRVMLMGHDVTALRPAARGLGYVPQDGALFSTMTVARHLAFALEIRRQSRAAIAARVDEMAELLEIKHLLDRYPERLSGGERQRVALGRALSFRPTVLLLDEPLSALDDETRHHMYEVLGRIRRHTRVTVLHITHNHEDAARLADRILRLENGCVHDS
ncbi:MAG: ATP-binding cassette domain-containing protein [Thermoguttaceae bacterium]|nr:ATP-binding cassette domain-containing protein [Thermoguttaceae bacterium]